MTRPGRASAGAGILCAVFVFWPGLPGVGVARAEEVVDASAPYAASARLDFRLTIDKFIYLRLGNAGSGIDTVAFALVPSIPPVPTPPVAGNGVAVPWNGGAPAFGVVATGAAVGVEVRSNAGAVSLRTVVAAPLSSGVDTIPVTDVGIVSDNPDLPAPPMPASGSGTGAAVAVAGSSQQNLVTERTATWTFTLSAVGRPAGVYTGQIAFTASAP
ncbi:MAG: hypothetical protein EOP70_04250 [Variovorax sp.]|nr:MAG: hypothetical protein EOP70_04250 [Variovorax sp.]